MQTLQFWNIYVLKTFKTLKSLHLYLCSTLQPKSCFAHLAQHSRMLKYKANSLNMYICSIFMHACKIIYILLLSVKRTNALEKISVYTIAGPHYAFAHFYY